MGLFTDMRKQKQWEDWEAFDAVEPELFSCQSRTSCGGRVSE